MEKITNSFYAFFSYPHEFCHYIVARLLKLEITEVCFYRVPSRENPSIGYIDIKHPEITTRSFMLRLGLVAIAPIILSVVISLIYYKLYIFLINLHFSNYNLTGLILLLVYQYLGFLYFGFAPTWKDTKTFLSCTFSAIVGVIGVREEDNSLTKTKIFWK